MQACKNNVEKARVSVFFERVAALDISSLRVCLDKALLECVDLEKSIIMEDGFILWTELLAQSMYSVIGLADEGLTITSKTAIDTNVNSLQDCVKQWKTEFSKAQSLPAWFLNSKKVSEMAFSGYNLSQICILLLTRLPLDRNLLVEMQEELMEKHREAVWAATKAALLAARQSGAEEGRLVMSPLPFRLVPSLEELAKAPFEELRNRPFTTKQWPLDLFKYLRGMPTSDFINGARWTISTVNQHALQSNQSDTLLELWTDDYLQVRQLGQSNATHLRINELALFLSLKDEHIHSDILPDFTEHRLDADINLSPTRTVIESRNSVNLYFSFGFLYGGLPQYITHRIVDFMEEDDLGGAVRVAAVVGRVSEAVAVIIGNQLQRTVFLCIN